MATLPTEIELQVVTPQRHVLQETVQSVELPGADGYLGVLPGHAPLLTELGVGILAYVKDGQTRYLTIAHGYSEVLPDRVIVLAEISEKAEEVDVQRSQAAKDRAQSALAKTPAGDAEWQAIAFDLERALVRLQAASRVGTSRGDGH
jgi:F-type H+-transporting ATPase subunit epsilon